MNEIKNGYIPSPVDERDHIYSVDIYGELPRRVVSPISPYRKDQLVNDCVANAIVAVLECYIYRQTGKWYTLSTGFLYGNREEYDSQRQGMIPREALQAVNHEGIMRIQEFDGANLEVPAIINAVNKHHEWLVPRGKPQAIEEYISCYTDIDSIKYALNQYGYALVGYPVYEDYHLDSNNVVRHTSDNIRGRHMVAVYGYNETGWLFVNSNGKSWGNNGCAVLPFDYPIEEAWNIIPNKELGKWYSDFEDNNKPVLPAYVRPVAVAPFEGDDGKPKVPPVKPPVAPLKPNTKILYKVQLGAFSIKANAEKFARGLKAKGYQCFIKFDKFYKVQLGAFSKRENAEKLLKELRAKGYQAFIKEE